MSLPRMVAEKISYPVTNILSRMESIVMPLGFSTAAPGDGSAPSYASVQPARRQFKPFIVGVLPPDVPVDFVPFRKVQNSVADVQPTAFPPDAVSGSPSGQARPGYKVGTGNRGEETPVKKQVKLGDLRQALYEQYFKQTGQYPSAQTVNLMAAQVLVEMGGSAASFPTTNYNLGNLHASGGKAPKGERPPPPTGGSYYYGTDYDGKNQPYGCYFESFDSLDSGAARQVYRLLDKWPDAANAQDSAAFTKGLLPGPPKNYFEAPPAVYQRGLDIRLSQIQSLIDKGQGGGVIGGLPVQESPSYSTPGLQTSDQSPRSVMSYGTSTQLESDPAGDRVGKFVEYDASRAAVVEQQKGALIRQIEALRSLPGLLLMVNPSDFSRSFEATVDNTVKTRYGNVVHMWLEKPTELSCSGVTAGQYVVGADGSGGITGELRVYSASYQNLLSLLSIYKANGVIRCGPESDLGIGQLGYSVFIYFDNFIYVGTFDSFEIQDTDTKPHNMSYDFRFNVRYCFDVGNDGRFTDFEIGVNNGFFPQVSV